MFKDYLYLIHKTKYKSRFKFGYHCIVTILIRKKNQTNKKINCKSKDYNAV